MQFDPSYQALFESTIRKEKQIVIFFIGISKKKLALLCCWSPCTLDTLHVCRLWFMIVAPLGHRHEWDTLVSFVLCPLNTEIYLKWVLFSVDGSFRVGCDKAVVMQWFQDQSASNYFYSWQTLSLSIHTVSTPPPPPPPRGAQRHPGEASLQEKRKNKKRGNVKKVKSYVTEEAKKQLKISMT